MKRGYDIAVYANSALKSLPMHKMLLHSGALTTVIIFVVFAGIAFNLDKTIHVHPYNQYRQTTRNSFIA